MKKILALVCGLVMCLSMVACGSSDDKSSSKEETSSAVSSNEESKAEEPKGDASKSEDSTAGGISTDAKTLEDFIEENKSTFDALNESLKNSGISLEVLARDNSLVYSYKYTIDTIKNDETTKKSLETSMKAQESTFDNALQSVKALVPETKSVIVEYLDSKGEVIKSFEFK